MGIVSVTKTNVSRENAAKIAAQYSNSPLAAFDELKDGYFNAAYAITLADGRKWVLKVSPPPSVRVLRYERGILRAEVEAMRLVSEHTSVPVPAIRGVDFSHGIIPNDYFLMDFVDGVPLNKLRGVLDADKIDAIDRQVGRYLREINAIRGTGFGYFNDPRYGTWREAFADMITGLLDDARDADVKLPRDIDDLQRILPTFYPLLDAVTDPVLVHWDLWDGNVFIDPETGRITGIIDFERAMWGDPLMEVNFSGMTPSLSGVGAFADGYGVDILDTPEKRQRRALYNVYLHFITVIEAVYRQYESPDMHTWAWGQLTAALDTLGIG